MWTDKRREQTGSKTEWRQRSARRERRTAEREKQQNAEQQNIERREKKESNRRACIIWLEGWENSQESQIASVLQIQQQIATAEGQDHDFNAEVKGTDSRGTIISLDSPWECDRSKETVCCWHSINDTNWRRGGRGDLEGRLILLNWPVQSYGAMGKITTGGTNPTSHAEAAEMAKLSPAHRPQGLGFDHRHRLPTINQVKKAQRWIKPTSSPDVTSALLLSLFAVWAVASTMDATRNTFIMHPLR